MLKRFFSDKKSESSGAAVVLNPLQNNINLILPTNKSNNFVDNVFMTRKEPSSNRKKLLLVSKDIFKELNNNKNRIKNNSVLNIKSLLIFDEKQIKFKDFFGQVKIWLIYNQLTQVLDYVIQIIPTTNFINNANKNIKSLINILLTKLDCGYILHIIERFGINVDKNRIENCKKYRWSFHLRDILFKQSLNQHLNNIALKGYTPGEVFLNPFNLSRAPHNNNF
jgi:hypothetical protein